MLNRRSAWSPMVAAWTVVAVLMSLLDTKSLGDAQIMRVGIGVYVLNVGEVDIVGGSSYLDYMLTIKQLKTTFPTYEEAITVGLADAQNRVCSNTEQDDWMPWNGTAPDIAVVNMKRTGEVRTLDEPGQFRVLGDHYFRTKLSDWPFETQTLELIIEFNDQLQAVDFDVVFCHIYEYSGLSSSIRFPGEATLMLTTSHLIVERCWPPFSAPNAKCSDSTTIISDCKCPPPPVIYHNESNHFSCRCQGGKKLSSRYYGQVSFDRPEKSAFIKVYLAPLFILLVIMLTYWLPPNKDETRFSMCAATLLAGIFFHVNLHTQLPPTSTLTEADTLMINIYVVNLFAWIVTIVIMLCREAKGIRKKMTMRIYLFTRVLGPVLSIPSFVITFYSDSSAWWSWVLTVFLGIVFSFVLLMVQEYVQARLDRRAEHLLQESRGESSPLRASGLYQRLGEGSGKRRANTPTGEHESEGL